MNMGDLKIVAEATGDVLSEELRSRDNRIKVLSAEVVQLRAIIASTDSLLSDLDQRVAALERMK